MSAAPDPPHLGKDSGARPATATSRNTYLQPPQTPSGGRARAGNLVAAHPAPPTQASQLRPGAPPGQDGRGGTGPGSSARPQSPFSTHAHPFLASYNPAASHSPSMPTATQSASPYGYPNPFAPAAPAFVPSPSSHGRRLLPHPSPQQSRGARHGPLLSTPHGADLSRSAERWLEASNQRMAELRSSQQQYDGPPTHSHTSESAFTGARPSGQQRGRRHPASSAIPGNPPLPHHPYRPAIDYDIQLQMWEAELTEQASLLAQTARTPQNHLRRPQRPPLLEIPNFDDDITDGDNDLDAHIRQNIINTALTDAERAQYRQRLFPHRDERWNPTQAELAAMRTNPSESPSTYPRPRSSRPYQPSGTMTDANRAILAAMLRAGGQPDALPQNFVSTLPRVPLSSLEDNEHDQRCDLCTDRYDYANKAEGREREDAVRLPCQHIFGHNCLRRWFNQQNTSRVPNTSCPMCRQHPMSSDEMEMRRRQAAQLLFHTPTPRADPPSSEVQSTPQLRTFDRPNAPQESPQSRHTVHDEPSQVPQPGSFSFSDTFLSQSSQGSQGRTSPIFPRTRPFNPREAPQGSPQNASLSSRGLRPSAVHAGRRPSGPYAAYVAWVQQRQARGDNVDLDDEWIAMGLDGRLAQAPPRQGPGFARYLQSMRARASGLNGQIRRGEAGVAMGVPDSEITGEYDDAEFLEGYEDDGDDYDDDEEEDDEEE